MDDRRRIIQQLQEWIKQIDEEIEKLIQDRYLHSSTIRELSKERSEGSNDSEEEILELSIEIIPQENKLKPFKSEKYSKQTKSQERQEGREKARVWALDRSRARKGK
jgi:seryl-tRNA(Sec) selenium transferase